MESKLINIKCDSCGAEFRISTRGELVCRYCGSMIYLSDKDFKAYKNTRDEMLKKERFLNDELASEGDILRLWNNSSIVNFTTSAGTTLSFESYYSVILPEKEIYVGNTRIAVVFNDRAAIARINDIVSGIEYPSADIKGLSKYLPNIIYKAALEDGRGIMMVSKAENIYPLYLFEDLKATTVAWMISRFENLGCLLEFNNLDFEAIRIEDIYINPKTHELFILDGWEGVSNTARRNYLRDIRTIAKEVMNVSTAPKLCMEFLDGNPAPTAYDDFKAWDNVIMKGFGGHNFHKFNE